MKRIVSATLLFYSPALITGAAEVKVTDRAGLMSALQKAGPGTVIVVAPGRWRTVTSPEEMVRQSGEDCRRA